MRFTILSLLTLLTTTTTTMATQTSPPQKSIIVSYPKGTPDWVVDQAKQAIISAGGIITHEYNLIKGFAAKAPETVMAEISSMSADGGYKANVEEDQVVTIQS